MAGLIGQYVAALKRELSFDPALARRMAEDVEAHLWHAAEADPAWPSAEAEQRAIERFGLAREIAAHFAADAVNRQAKRTWSALLATVAVTFVAMRRSGGPGRRDLRFSSIAGLARSLGRIWYESMRWQP